MTDTTQTTLPKKKQAKPVRHTKRCSFDGCPGWAWAQGYCDSHYQKLKREGVIKKVRLFGDPVERFLTKIEKNPETGCWDWKGGVHPHGYGQYSVHENGSSRQYRAHRFAYEKLVGPIPEGMKVLHSCDRRICCSPSHLRLGTQTENMRECVEKGRDGPSRGKSRQKITKQMALQIRIMYARGLPFAYGNKPNPFSMLKLAWMYGVEEETIRTIVKGLAHLEA